MGWIIFAIIVLIDTIGSILRYSKIRHLPWWAKVIPFIWLKY
jgi:hypothetical protein